MRFGLFDHIDRSADRPLAQQFDERLELIAAADEAGFYCYHLAEHHATPLNMAPVPGVFLGAVARATKRIRMGPMVYLLPLYSPLRMIEEISLLDHLSNGRAEIGVGRGVSPFELNFHNISAEQSRDIFIDAFDCVKTGLTHDRLTYAGPYYQYTDVPIALRPLQQPYPAFWYGSSNTVGAAWAGERGLHFASNGSTERAKVNIDAYLVALAANGNHVDVPHPEFSGGRAVGVSRQIVVAASDAEARRIAEPAHDHLAANLNFLRSEAVRTGKVTASAAVTVAPNPSAGAFAASLAEGSSIAGTPDTVRAEIERQIAQLGINYMILYFMFGSMRLDDALRSLRLFSTEVKPALEGG